MHHRPTDVRTDMEMPRRQGDALLAVVELARAHRWHDEEEALHYDHARHRSMEGFSKAYVRQFGHLAARRKRSLLLHAGCSLVDKKDAVGLPIQAVGLTGPCCVLLLRAVGPHRLVGRPGPELDAVTRVLAAHAHAVGPVVTEPWAM